MYAQQRVPVVAAAALVAAAVLPAHSQSGKTLLLLRVAVHEGKASLEPIAVLGGKGRYAPPEEGSDARRKAFIKAHLSAGKEYRLLRGGAPAGTARLTGGPGDEQIDLAAPATLTPATLRFRDEEGALATNSPRLGGGKTWARREPTPAERQQAVAVARSQMGTRGLPSAARVRFDTERVIVLTPSGGGRPLLFVTVTAPPVKQNADEGYGLFLILEADAAGRFGNRPSLALFHKPDGYNTPQRVDLIDAADLDGDGSPELVLENIYYESYDFSIYTRGKSSAGAWRQVYRGGGGGV